jgi:hypothetical protein
MIISPILRQEGETLEQYKDRLVLNKEAYRLSWHDIAQLWFDHTGERLSDDSFRKHRERLFKKMDTQQEYIDIAVTKEEDHLTSIEDELLQKELQLRKEKIKLHTTGVHINRIIREDARREQLYEEFIRAVKESALTPPPSFRDYSPTPHNVVRGGLLGFGDIHFGKIFESINNKYDEDQVYYRLEDLLFQTVRKCEQEGLDKIHVVNGADSIEGIGLRISQLMSLQFGLVDQTIRFCRLMVSWLNQLSKYLKIVYHHVPSCNHAEIRPLGTKAGQFPKEDMERLIAVYIRDMLQHNSRIEIPEYKDDYAKFEICGYKFMAKHGHQIKNIKTALKDLSMLHREFIDYLILSHYHHAEEITVGEGATNDCEVIILPSVMGSDKYSDMLMTGAKAAGKLLIFEEGKGKVTSHTLKLN